MAQKIAIIDYGSGNLHSAYKAFEHAARALKNEVSIQLTASIKDVKAADHIVLPGVGAFADCYQGLNAIEGMIETLNEAVLRQAKPFLGICVGMQLMAKSGFEHQKTSGLGWIEGDIVKIKPEDKSLKIPHMGWNTLSLKQAHPLFEGMKTGDQGLHAYYVHSYHFKAHHTENIIATSHYGMAITACIGHKNMVGVQFHPEKSQALGLALIKNFMEWKP